jgi:TPR repeat protein
MLDRFAGLMSASALRRAIRLLDEGRADWGFKLLVRAARAGVTEAQFRIGRCYLRGSGVPASRAEGARWLEIAATAGHTEAQWLLAALLIEGVRMPIKRAACAGERGAASLFSSDEAAEPDFVQAEIWARRAAEGESADGQAVLAFILSAGPEAMRNEAKAVSWYHLSACGGSPQGDLGYGLSLLRSAKGQHDRERKSAEHISRAAKAELPPAIYWLGVLTEGGTGTERDLAAAAQLYRRAAALGHRSAQAKWGRALIAGLGVDRNPTEGETWLRRAAFAGDPEAATLLGNLYAANDKLPPNFAEAAIWFRRAAEAGDPAAARALGLMCLNGAGTPRDPQEAAHWLRIATDACDGRARLELASLILRGLADSDAEGKASAREWLERAAESRNFTAALNLGLCLLDGIGVEKDERQAAQWLRRAADGVALGQYWYGRALVEGRGVRANAEAGRTWIARAAAVGVPEAEAALAEMMVNGRGGAADRRTAMALFEKAADKGHVGAMFALGALTDQASNSALSQRWLRAAAERGHGKAQQMLGRYLAQGLAGERDLEEARLWFAKAAAQGIADAEYDLAAPSLPPI